MAASFEEFRKNLTFYEGEVQHMYLDSERKVTVGIGHLIDSKSGVADLPFVKQDSLKPATLAEKEAEFVLLGGSDVPVYITGGKNLWYNKNTTLILLKNDIDTIFDNDVKVKETDLVRNYPDYKTYPTGAKYALLDMAFNLGITGLSRFTNFNVAIKKREFAKAIKDSHRLKIAEQRNLYVKRALENAAADEALKPLKPSELGSKKAMTDALEKRMKNGTIALLEKKQKVKVLRPLKSEHTNTLARKVNKNQHMKAIKPFKANDTIRAGTGGTIKKRQ